MWCRKSCAPAWRYFDLAFRCRPRLRSEDVLCRRLAAASKEQNEPTLGTGLAAQGGLGVESSIVPQSRELEPTKDKSPPMSTEPESQNRRDGQDVKLNIAEVQEDAHLHREPGQVDTASAEPIKRGELVLARPDLIVSFPDAEDSPWVFVQVPKDTAVKAMSDEPLTYEDGWLRQNALGEIPWKMGERAAVTAPDPPEHPALSVFRIYPQWRDGIPRWLSHTCAEHFPGKVYGCIVGGEIVVQRPGGAIPERLSAVYADLLRPKDRAKIVAKSTALGLLGAALAMGIAYSYISYDRVRKGGRKMTWHGYVQWLGFGGLILTPIAYIPCFIFCMTPFGTCSFIFWANAMLFYDLFHE